MPLGTKMAAKAVKRTAKKEVKDAVGLDNEKKHNRKDKNKVGKKKGRKRGKGIL